MFLCPMGAAILDDDLAHHHLNYHTKTYKRPAVTEISHLP